MWEPSVVPMNSALLEDFERLRDFVNAQLASFEGVVEKEPGHWVFPPSQRVSLWLEEQGSWSYGVRGQRNQGKLQFVVTYPYGHHESFAEKTKKNVEHSWRAPPSERTAKRAILFASERAAQYTR